jgi:hypothetical protein
MLQSRTTLQCPPPQLFHPPHQGVTSNQVSLVAGANVPYLYYQLDSQRWQLHVPSCDLWSWANLHTSRYQEEWHQVVGYQL